MYRGTTPTLKIKIKEKGTGDNINLSQFSSIYLTLKQGEKEITKEKDDMQIEKENMVSIWLSQEETLKFSKGHIDVQLRAVTNDGIAVASEIKMIFAEQILKDGVIS